MPALTPATPTPTLRTTTSVPYCWVITQDLDNPFDDSPDAKELGIPSRVGVAGPRNATPEDICEALDNGQFFRILDDDGHAYYIGRILLAAGTPDEYLFAPLDDYGRADVGAVDIQYRNNQEWETL